MLNLREKGLRDIRKKKGFVNPDAKKKVSEVYGEAVFGNAQLQKQLHRSSYANFRKSLETGAPLDPKVADEIAAAMKEWAISKGATHFTHWFQPLTGLTAEKHDSFLGFHGGPYNREITVEFSGKQLIKGESDASSFPNGGIRSTFEARGYTAWDMESPSFIREGENGTFLVIPCAFASWTGEALDMKTPLLRSNEAIGRATGRLCQVLGNKAITGGYSNVGIEQEFFLIDRGFYIGRPDLLTCGRTLLGAAPAKGQQMEDHYFGALDSRILSFLQDAEWRLWKLGVPTTTRHYEVAPSQYEMAPIFETISVACDHNMLMMEVLKETAKDHDFACLFHEKPFAGVNGSGKHNNWSICTNTGENLMEPGATPAKNAQFMVVLAALVRAVHLNGDLMRSAIAVPGNDFRLGANEAPPAIMSLYVGDLLSQVIQDFVEEPSSKLARRPSTMNLGATSLPSIPKDFSDRNRTSPFAFTGNKFEFRAVGSSQSCARPGTILNTIMADSMDYMSDEIEAAVKAGKSLEDAIQHVVTTTLKEHHHSVFNGNGYSAEWVQLAEKRGLKNIRTLPEAVLAFGAEKNKSLFERQRVLTRREMESQQHTLFENFSKNTAIEADCLSHMIGSMVLPAALEYKQKLIQTLDAKEGPQARLLEKFNKALNDLITSSEELKNVTVDVASPPASPVMGGGHVDNAEELAVDTLYKEATYFRTVVFDAMAKARAASDAIELLVDDKLWPLPKYSEILFLR